MAAWTAVVRQASNLTRLSSPRSASQATSLIHRRCLAGGGVSGESVIQHQPNIALQVLEILKPKAVLDHHGPPKVNCWQDPLSPSKWKEEHFVIVSLSGWGLLFYGGVIRFSPGARKTTRQRRKLEMLPTRLAFASS